MSALDLLTVLLAAPPTILLLVFTMEVVAGLTRPKIQKSGASTPRFTVLIPAHNEAEGIADTIQSLRSANPAVDLLVVADNCTDETARRAANAGARVIERIDPVRRGKGYALAFGRDALQTGPPDCVVILDADCAVGGAGVAALARIAVFTRRAIQARNLQRPDLTATPTAQISNFAFLIKNLIRQRGMVRLGGVAALTGTGMAIPWEQFAAAPLASADLAEDLALGVWLTKTGRPPHSDETVHIWSDAASGKALLVQRSRWERGFLAVAKRQALPLIARGLCTRSRGALWLGLHLVVPPLALLFAGGSVAWLLTVLVAVFGGSFLPAAILAIVLTGAIVATVAAWAAEGRDQIDGRALLRTPFYIAAKLPLYRALLRRSDNGWIRTERQGDFDA